MQRLKVSESKKKPNFPVHDISDIKTRKYRGFIDTFHVDYVRQSKNLEEKQKILTKK